VTAALLSGVLAGVMAFKKLKEGLFRKMVLIIVLISGSWTIISTLMDILGQP